MNTRDAAAEAVLPRHILLVEDNPADVRLVQIMLEEDAGPTLQLTHADRLGRAWKLLAEQDVGCILLDLNLPDAEGLEAVDRLRNVAPEVPIIILSGRDDLAMAVQALQMGAQDYLIKDRVDAQLLMRALRYAVERKRSEQALVHQALHDPLTGLPNRALFVDRLEQALVRNSQLRTLTAVLFVDLDRFKVVNDSLGHAAGDRLLVGLTGRLRASLRPSDTVARFGGDEFTVLCSDIEAQEEALTIAERIQEALVSPFHVDGAAVVLTASIGIALTNGAGESATAVMRNADAAMYRAKERGRGGWVIFDESIRRRAVQRLETEVALRHSLEHGDFRLVYQPVLDPERGRLAGFEALVRWQHPQRGLLSPSEFIPVAEETGLIASLGTWVLTEACRQARRWRELEGMGHLLISVNVSACQLVGDAMSGAVERALTETGLAPEALCLEITESAVMHSPEATTRSLEALHATGVRLAVDDFGTGHHSLRNLKRFPVDFLKLDRSFVAGLGHDRADAAISMAVIRLARALDLCTIAEGVETREQLELLQTLGCDLIQGYHVGEPRPAEDAMRAWRCTTRPPVS